MKYNESGAFIVSETKNGDRIVSCEGRLCCEKQTEMKRKFDNME